MARENILVVDDEPDMRDALTAALRREGLCVSTAANGVEALEKVQGQAFDLIITDLSMPESSGLEVTHAVKTISPGTPVIMITGWGHLLNLDRMRDSQVDLVLVKPFKMERMLSAVGNALALRASR